MFGNESVATDEYPGLLEVWNHWKDAEGPGFLGKPSNAAVIRNFEADSTGGLRRGFDALVADAEASGWEPYATSTATLYNANKHFPQGDAHLLIWMSKVSQPHIVTLRMEARSN